MKTIRWAVLAVVPLLAVACGEGAVKGTQTAPGPSAAEVELRIQGDNASAGGLFLTLGDVEVTANGKPLAVQGTRTNILDLSRTDQAWLVGTFHVPLGVDSVHVKVGFDSFGGLQESTGGKVVDARTRPIEFDAPVASLTARGHAVVHVDQQRSIASLGDSTGLLLPRVKVEY